MCPLWPAHYFMIYILILTPLWLLSFNIVAAVAQIANENWEVTYVKSSNFDNIVVGATEEVLVKFDLKKLKDEAQNGLVDFEFKIDDSNLAELDNPNFTINSSILHEDDIAVNITGTFLGKTKLHIKRRDKATDLDYVAEPLEIIVVRGKGVLDRVFTISVAVLVGIIYINMGAALDKKIVKETLKKPIGPAIGFFTQFVIMPVLAYAIGKLLLPLPSLQLGLFITGCSPGGGASNIWTLTLGGNLDLSITMTTISTLAAFVMMPLWIFTLGATILKEANLTIPYKNIAYIAFALVFPITIGILIQRFFPKVAKFLVRILKPFAVILILYIIIFAVYTNLFLFKLFDWRIVASGILLPWLGYILGGGTAWLLRQHWRDVLAIGIETGVQNTGLSILALRFSLPAPESDLTTVLPVAVAIMTPILPLFLFIFQKVTGIGGKKPLEKQDPVVFATSTPTSPTSD